MSDIQMEIDFLKEFDQLLTHVRNLEIESAVGKISTRQLLKDLKAITNKAEQTLEGPKENKAYGED